MPQQLRQVVERINLIQFAGVDQAHEKIAHTRSVHKSYRRARSYDAGLPKRRSRLRGNRTIQLSLEMYGLPTTQGHAERFPPL
jgi:hypothetical protein